MFRNPDPTDFNTCPGCGNPWNKCTCEPEGLEDDDQEW